jgi:hypothetical protein
MKSTIRIKTINGKEYWYEDIPYYDKEKKQIRHRSKYLGKNIDGKPVRVRSESMIPASMRVADAPVPTPMETFCRSRRSPRNCRSGQRLRSS